MYGKSNYDSSRAVGAPYSRTLSIRLKEGAPLSAVTRRVELEIKVAGTTRKETFYPPAVPEIYVWEWDGKDSFGRQTEGVQNADIKTTNHFDPVYKVPEVSAASFGKTASSGGGGGGGGVIGGAIKERFDVFYARQWTEKLNAGWSSGDIGGWTLGVHHRLDPSTGTIRLGTGGRIATTVSTITTVAGRGKQDSAFSGEGGPAILADIGKPRDVAVGPDGSLFIAAEQGDNYVHSRLWKVDSHGIITVLADKTQEQDWIRTVAVAPSGDAYFAAGRQVFRVPPTPNSQPVAFACGGGDGNPHADQLALQAPCQAVRDLAVGPDQSVYILFQWRDPAVVQVDTAGVMHPIIGTSGINDTYPAPRAWVDAFVLGSQMAVRPQGGLLIADDTKSRVVQADPSGWVSISVNSYSSEHVLLGDGASALTAGIYNPVGVAIDNDGATYINEGCRIRRVSPSGVIDTIAGYKGAYAINRSCGYVTDGKPEDDAKDEEPRSAYGSRLNAETYGGIALGPHHELYIADHGNGRVRRIIDAPPMAQDIYLPSEDGQEIYVFDGQGRHLRTLDTLTDKVVNGQHTAVLWEFIYDANHLLSGAFDRDRRPYQIVRNANSTVDIITPDLVATHVEVNGPGGMVASVKNPQNRTTNLGYQGTSGLLTEMVGVNGDFHRFAYDINGRLIADRDPLTLVETDLPFKGLVRQNLPLPAAGWEVPLTTALGTVTTYKVELLTDPLKGNDEKSTTTFPGGGTDVTERYNGTQAKHTFRDSTVEETVLAADPRFGMNAPYARKTTTTVSASPLLVRAENVSRTADNAGDPNNWTTLTDTWTVDGTPTKTTSTYNKNSRTVTIASGTTPTRQVVLTYDPTGRVVEIAPSGLASTSLSYDSRTGNVSEVDRNGTTRRTTLMEYDSSGLLAKITDALGQETHLGYDDLRRVKSITRPDGKAISQTYDWAGNAVAVGPPEKLVHSLGYTPVNLLESYTPPNNTIVTYHYDKNRHLANAQYADNRSADVTWDYQKGHLDHVTTSDGETVRLYYDSSGIVNKSELQIGSDTVTTNLERYGRLPKSMEWLETGTTPVNGKVEWGYYQSSLLLHTETVDSAQQVVYSYDDDELVNGATIGSNSVTFQRGPATGLIDSAILTGTGWSLDYHYDEFGELASFGLKNGATDYYRVVYDSTSAPRDARGRVVHKTETMLVGVPDQQTYDYTYDSAQRLKSARDSGGTTQYTYDANGNRTGCGYDLQDRLVNCGTTDYGNDAVGRRSSKTVSGALTTYGYDTFGNLKSVTPPAPAGAITYVLDAQKRRVGKKVNGALTEQYLYRDGYRIVAVKNGSGVLLWRFVYATGRHVPDFAVDGAGDLYWIVTDELGSLRMVIKASDASVKQSMRHDAWGKVVADPQAPIGFTKVPFGFAGGLYDRDTGLVHFGAREYDPETGRWMTKDPILFGGGDTNLYGYVGGDPVNGVDPLGLLEPGEYGSDFSTIMLGPIGEGAMYTFAGIAVVATGAGLGAAYVEAAGVVFVGSAGTGTLSTIGSAASASWQSVKDNWFRVDWNQTQGWKERGIPMEPYPHLHADPVPGSKELMQWHLPYQLNEWLHNLDSIRERGCK